MHQRSPILFWLLLAATISVDVVAVYWNLTTQRSRFSIVVLFALANAQISSVAISTVFAETWTWQRWLAPFGAALAAAVILLFTSNRSFDAESLITAFVIFELHALIVIGALLLVRQFRGAARRWQISLWQVLVVMTVTALIVPSVQATKLPRSEWQTLAVMIVSNVLLAAVAVTAYRAVGHWLLRLGSLLGVAFFAGWAWNYLDFPPGPRWNWHAFNLVQAVVLWVWLIWGRIMPPDSVADGGLPEEPVPNSPT